MEHIPLPNIFSEFKKASSSSVVSNGKLPILNDLIYVEDEIDNQIKKWIDNPKEKRLCILTGSAGHGKSAAIARAQRYCEKKGLGDYLRIHYDATHSDNPKKNNRENLRAFLDPFSEGKAAPKEHYLLAMNLGLAMNFFSNVEDLEKWNGLAALLDNSFKLGLHTKDNPRNDVLLLDMTSRFKLELWEGIPTIPFVRDLLLKFDLKEDTPVKIAVQKECSSCERKEKCPIFFNVMILSNEQIRKNLIYSITVSVVKACLFLTPRNLLDFISYIIIPYRLFPHIKSTQDKICPLKNIPINELFMDDWENRLDDTIFNLTFQKLNTNTEPEKIRKKSNHPNLIIENMDLADPSTFRDKELDDLLLEWMANPGQILIKMPDPFKSYIGEIKFPTKITTLTTLLRIYLWTKFNISELEHMIPFNKFIKLCLNDSETQQECTTPHEDAFEKIATGQFHDGKRKEMKIRILDEELPECSLLADFPKLNVEFIRSNGILKANDVKYKVRISTTMDRGSKPELILEWNHFEILNEIMNGYFPSQSALITRMFQEKVTKKLEEISSKSDTLEVKMADNTILKLKRRQSPDTKRISIEAKVGR
jgi:DNA phosphorothioation-dependent restriction protein DptF